MKMDKRIEELVMIGFDLLGSGDLPIEEVRILRYLFVEGYYKHVTWSEIIPGGQYEWLVRLSSRLKNSPREYAEQREKEFDLLVNNPQEHVKQREKEEKEFD